MGIPNRLLSQWKREYGAVFLMESGEDIFAFRELRFDEFDDITTGLGDSYSFNQIEDDLLDRCVLWPEDFDADHYMPGVMAQLAAEIMDESGLNEDVHTIRSMLDEYRTKFSGVRGEMCSFILLAMPQYRLDDLGKITMRKLTELVVMAEKVIALRQLSEGYDDIEIKMRVYTQEELDEMGAQKIADGGTATVDDPIARKLHGLQ